MAYHYNHSLVVLMGSHPRAGKDSLLYTLDPDVLRRIVLASIPPIVERPIYAHSRTINDTVTLSEYGRARSRYVCTVLDDGVLVFREAMPQQHNVGSSQLMYTSRLKNDMQVRFCVRQDQKCPGGGPVIVTEWLYNHEGIKVLGAGDYLTNLAKIEAYRQRNELGIELRLSMTRPVEVDNGPWTPILKEHDPFRIKK